MHDLALPSSGRASGTGDACLFGLSLCSGAGGLDLGLTIAMPGYRTVGHVERETYAAAILVARMEEAALDPAPVWDDVASFDGRPWRGAVDIVTAGYPCQPFSVAGKRRGADDPRHLWPHVARIIGEVDRPSSSSRMSPIISASASPKSPQDWSAWATALRQASSRRRKSARPTSASGSSSSRTERTANWPTPRACSGTRSSGGNRTEMLRLWPTPRASANENRQTKPTPSQEAGKHGMNLATSAAMWPTPQTDSFRSRGGARKHEKGLDGMARDWPTPMATDGNKPSAGNRKSADLTRASQMWMTPTARDHKDGATTLANTPVNGLLGRQVLVTPTAGSDTSEPRRTLNPHSSRH